MKEDFIYYLWENRLFYNNLQTVNNEDITIISTGIRNHNSGADFINARIKINNTLWAGHVEMHILASDWFKHKHHQDDNYNNVILHVVYINDTDKIRIPTLELKNKFNPSLYDNYSYFINSKSWLPCSNFIGNIQNFTLISWIDRMLVENLERQCIELNVKFKMQNAKKTTTTGNRLSIKGSCDILD